MNNDDRHLLTDEAVLDTLEAAASKRNHSVFDHYEDVLYQRYVKFDTETADVPFDREKVVRQFFPEGIQDRYFAIREKIYPKL
jgi:hypothetical protein